MASDDVRPTLVIDAVLRHEAERHSLQSKTDAASVSSDATSFDAERPAEEILMIVD